MSFLIVNFEQSCYQRMVNQKQPSIGNCEKIKKLLLNLRGRNSFLNKLPRESNLPKLKLTTPNKSFENLVLMLPTLRSFFERFHKTASDI